MTILDIKKTIDFINDKSNPINVGLYLIYFTKKNRNVKIISLSIDKSIQEDLTEITIDRLRDNLDVEQVPYDIIGDPGENKLEIESKHIYSDSINNVVEKIKSPYRYDDPQFVSSGFQYFIYDFYSQKENRSVFAFRKINKFQRFKKGIMGYASNGEFKKLEEPNLLATDKSIDVVIDDDDIAILRHSSFELIFNLNQQFLISAKKFLNNELFSDKIVNFDKLKKDALENKSIIKRIAKDTHDNDYTLFLKNIDKVKDVIGKRNLKIKISDDSKVIYEDKKQLKSFIDFMKDAYYVTSIGDKEGIDNRR